VTLLLLALALGAGYQAGTARLEIAPERVVEALAIEDAEGGRVVFASAAGESLPLTLTDLVTARTGLERSQLVFLGGHGGGGYDPALAGGLVTAIGAALGALKPAALTYDAGASLQVLSEEELRASVAFRKTTALLEVGSGVAAGGQPISGRIRAAFQMVEPEPSLRARGNEEGRGEGVPVQAVRFGKGLTLVVVGGELAAGLRERIGQGKEPLEIVETGGVPIRPDREVAVIEGVRRVLERVKR
jgi:hypothetical protein